MASRSRVLGASSLRRKLKRMPDEIKKPVQKALQRGADVIHAAALSNIPVDEGDLAKALHRNRSSDGLGQKIGYWKKGNIRNWRLAGWRAHFTEFGTVKDKAQPFLGPAFRSQKNWIKRHVNAAVNRALRKASKL